MEITGVAVKPAALAQVTNHTAKIPTLIVGGGQAGLALSYYLSQAGHPHLVLEAAAQPAHAWRNQRWDSFTYVTPNWMNALPGAPIENADPDGYLARDEIIRYFEQYSSRFNLPVQYHTHVTSVTPAQGGYQVATSQGDYLAHNVVIATGFFQSPRLPAYHSQLPEDLQQLHTSQYRNPKQLQPGAVFVIGSGQSGCQVAEELYQSGRKVYLSVGSTGRLPRRYRGKDATWWFVQAGQFDQVFDANTPPQVRFGGAPQLSGTRGGHSLNLHQFARDGVQLLGHVATLQGNKVFLAPDLKDSLERVDAFERQALQRIDMLIAKKGLPYPPEEIPVLTDGYQSEIITCLDLKQDGITNVIWATGYLYDYSLVKAPVFDGRGYPRQTRGVTDCPGLYFLGLHGLYKAKSGFLYGIGEDAAYLAETILLKS